LVAAGERGAGSWVEARRVAAAWAAGEVGHGAGARAPGVAGFA
jgi:hypothetical protein